MKVYIRTPHITPRSIKELLPKFKGKGIAIVRFGASSKSVATPCAVEINPLQNVRDNADKLLMKQKFAENDIPSPDFAPNTEEGRNLFKEKGWNVVYKKKYHRGGIGMELVSLAEIDKFAANQYNNGILERRINIKREWRIHYCPALNLHFSVEKRKRYAKVGEVVRNNENCVFKADFEIPENWDSALAMAKKAVEVMGLDIGAVDLAWSGKNFYVIETNSGPGMGDSTSAWYAQTLVQLIKHKRDNQ